jgi:hypothetical protein
VQISSDRLSLVARKRFVALESVLIKAKGSTLPSFDKYSHATHYYSSCLLGRVLHSTMADSQSSSNCHHTITSCNSFFSGISIMQNIIFPFLLCST